MFTHVLIVDSDAAFATLLKEGLEADREIRAITAPDGPSALAALQSNAFDLAIVDLGLQAPEPMLMLRAIRSLQPELPLMVIPIEGDLVPRELAPFEIKGVLTKPFFLPDLPARVAETLGRPLPPDPPIAAAAPPAPPLKKTMRRALPHISLARDDPRVTEALDKLGQALNAQSVLLTANDVLVAHTGALEHAGVETIARRILRSRAALEQSSWTGLANEQVRFGQSISDSGEHVLYSVDVAEGIVLTVAVHPSLSLRLIRAQTRQAAEALVGLGG
ncbi:MAG TPA: response regulator [Anaerolineae bacterium]|nr:response regulator [Anaerolineae bacterium]